MKEDKTCQLPSCDKPLVRHNASHKEWAKRKYCSLTCANAAQRGPAHGTVAAARRCRQTRGGKPCGVCMAAEIAYRAQRRAANPHEMEARKAQARARYRLAAMFPDHYKALLHHELHRVRDEKRRAA